MLRLPLIWGAAGFETIGEDRPDDYADELIRQSTTIRRGFSGIAELDFDVVGTPLHDVPNRNVLKKRLEFLAYSIGRMLRERCALPLSGIAMDFVDNKLTVTIKRRGARDATYRL
jgi:hypothetical protein